MTCPIPSAHTRQQRNDLKQKLKKSSIFRFTNEETLDDIAEHALRCNNGWDLTLDLYGNDSKLYKLLLYVYGNQYDAFAAKCYIYTPQFSEKHGTWIKELSDQGYEYPEPTYDDIRKDVESNDVENVLSSISTEQLNDFYSDVVYNAVIDEEFGHILVPGVSEDGTNKLQEGIKTARSHYVNDEIKKLEDSGFFNSSSFTSEEEKKSAKRQLEVKFRYEYHRKLIQKLTNDAQRKMAKSWGLRKSEDGLYRYDGKNNIRKLRCEFLNNLVFNQNTPSKILPIVRLAVNFLHNKSTKDLSKSFIETSLDLFKESEVSYVIFEQLGYDIRDKNNEIDKNKVAIAFQNIKENVLAESNEFIGNNNTFRKIRDGLSNAISWIWNSIFGILGFIADKSVLYPIGAASIVGYLYGGIPMMFTGAVAGFISGAMLAKNFQNHENNTFRSNKQEMHEACKEMIAILVSNKEFNELDEIKSIVSEKRKQFIESISELKYDEYLKQASNKYGTTISKALVELAESINTQILSMKSKSNNDLYSLEQISELLTYKDECVKAFKSNLNNTSDKLQTTYNFFFNYLSYVTKRLESDIDYLKSIVDRIDAVNSENISNKEKQQRIDDIATNIDIKKVMRINTDSIGAFSSTIADNLNRLIGYLRGITGFDIGDDLYNLVNDTIGAQCDLATRYFKTIVDTCIKAQINQYLDETANKILPTKQADLLKLNMYAWLRSLIHNYGNVDIIGKFITPNRDSVSPIIRMVHQRLMEIRYNTQNKAQLAGNSLETLRDNSYKYEVSVDGEYVYKDGKFIEYNPRIHEGEIRYSKKNIVSSAFKHLVSRLSFFNVLQKYCERDSDGKFTGNFIRDVNYGQYISDRKKFISALNSKYKDRLFRNPNGEIEFPNDNDETWKQYHIDLIRWEGGGTVQYKNKFSKDFTVSKPTPGQEPRINKRFLPEYYETRVNILGKQGVEKLLNLNQQISDIYEKCLIEISYEKNGKIIKAKVPVISKLSQEYKNRLLYLQNEKDLLGSNKSVIFDETGNYVVDIIDKPDGEKELVARFARWNNLKSKWYNPQQIADTSKYEAVMQYYDNLINNAEDNDVKNQLTIEKELFKKENTQLRLKDYFQKKVNSKREREYDENNPLFMELKGLRKARAVLIKRIQSDNIMRTINLDKIGKKEDINNVTDEELIGVHLVWEKIKTLDELIKDLENKIKPINEVILRQKEVGSNILISGSVPKLNANREETTMSYTKYMTSRLGFQNKFFKYGKNDEYVISLLTRRTINIDAVRRYKMRSEFDFYEEKPIGMFAQVDSAVDNVNFDENSEDYLLINKSFTENGKKIYDNSKAFNEIKNDPLYNEMLRLMNEAWSYYDGYARGYKYKLPLRSASTSDLLTRTFAKGWYLKSRFSTFGKALGNVFSNTYSFTDRDTEFTDQVITRPDGTIVETIPSRWLNMINDTNTIDTDLISSVLDFYTEAVRYDERKKKEPLMEALMFTLRNGKSTNLADVIEGELQSELYGRELTGFGHGGRASGINEQKLMKLSKMFRKAMHARLMSHNWLSVIKNGLDSFFNLLQTAITGKYIMTVNLARGIADLVFNLRNESFWWFGGFNRSKATTLTLALMQMNYIHQTASERYKKQHQYYLHRLLSRTSTIEFEPIDYSAKAIITASVYDSYRLIYDEKTGKNMFLNHEEAELLYLKNKRSRKEGYDAWRKSKATLKDAYELQNGVAKLKKEYYDIIRPYSNISNNEDGRSTVFETRIQTELTQIASTVNGMLAELDKQPFARNYVGALTVAFRGWMISQSGEYYKNGTDFYNFGMNDQLELSKYYKNYTKFEKLKSAGILDKEDRDFEGQYNFGTGTIDKGLHRGLMTALGKNLISFMTMLIPFSSQFYNYRLSGKMSQSEYYTLRNFACALLFMFTTVALTCYAFALYSGADDGDDDEFFSKKARYSLFYTSMLASISERFPQLGFLPFISGGLDIIKSLTVGTSLIDDAHFILNAVYNILNVAEKERLEYLSETEEGYKEDYENALEKYSDLFSNLNNATFKGRTKFDRDLTRAIALVPVDNLPILLTLDGLNYLAKQYDIQPDLTKDIRFTDYNLNVYKSGTEIGNMLRAKWYKSLIPTEWVVNILNSINEIKGIPVLIYPEKSESGGGRSSHSFGHSYGHSFGHKY